MSVILWHSWPLAEDGDCFAALQIEPLQRTVGRASAAGDGGACLERERVGQAHECINRHFHVPSVSAGAMFAELLPLRSSASRPVKGVYAVEQPQHSPGGPQRAACKSLFALTQPPIALHQKAP